MNKQLQFIQSCVRQGVSTDDIGYITKWYFSKEVSDEEYFASVQASINDKFFDNNNKIQAILTSYTS